jgi:hypothetical protein
MLLARLLEAFLIRRFLSRGRRGRGPAYGYGRRRGRPAYGYGRRRGRARFVGPFPTYTTRTRRGSRVTVTGCCLPLPLALVTTTVLGARALLRR